MRIITIILFIYTPWAMAQTDQVCTDLFKFSCAPGVYNDGTGFSSSPRNVNDKMNESLNKYGFKAKERFATALKDPQNGALRRGILSASGLTMRKDCQGADEAPTGECLNLMSEFGAQMFFWGNSQFRSNKQIVEPADLDERAYILQLDAFQKIRDDLKSEIGRDLGANALDEKMRAMIPSLKNLLIAKIKEKVKDPKAQLIMINRVKDAIPGGSHCEDGEFASIPEVMMPNAFYNAISRKVSYCLGHSIRTNSIFRMAYAIAHELAHSFDPCFIQMGPKDFSWQYKSKSYAEAEWEYPLQSLISCLRRPTSVKAERNLSENKKTAAPFAQNTCLPNGIDAQTNQACTPAIHEPFSSFCNNDQIGEATSDWWAYEILPEYMAENYKNLSQDQVRIGYSNIARPFCAEEEAGDSRAIFDEHPTRRRRTDFILLTQAKIRKHMGCPEVLPDGREYCSGQEAPTAVTTPVPIYYNKIEGPVKPVETHK